MMSSTLSVETLVLSKTKNFSRLGSLANILSGVHRSLNFWSIAALVHKCLNDGMIILEYWNVTNVSNESNKIKLKLVVKSNIGTDYPLSNDHLFKINV